MENWNNIYITDCNGGKHFKCIASPLSTMSEIKNLQTHLKNAKTHPKMYAFLDIDTAFIVLNDKPY
jgi:hypothetical protein